MTRLISKTLLGLSSSILLMSCGATALISTPIENIDTTPLKIADLTDAQKQKLGAFRPCFRYHTRYECRQGIPRYYQKQKR